MEEALERVGIQLVPVEFRLQRFMEFLHTTKMKAARLVQEQETIVTDEDIDSILSNGEDSM